MAASIDKPMFERGISNRAVVRAGERWFSIDSTETGESVCSCDRETAAKLRDALNDWLKDAPDLRARVAELEAELADVRGQSSAHLKANRAYVESLEQDRRNLRDSLTLSRNEAAKNGSEWLTLNNEPEACP